MKNFVFFGDDLTEMIAQMHFIIELQDYALEE